MAATLRRGFKAEAERNSLALRAELGLKAGDCLDWFRLSEHLGIPVVSLEQLVNDGASSASVARLMTRRAGLSALTVCRGTFRLIVYNPAHAPGRRANFLAHEFAHVILEHPPAPAFADGGCRRWNAVLEAEADWQSGALLVPRDGALEWFQDGGTVADGALHFGVSQALFRWRVNQTGVLRQLNTSARRRGLH